jgi:hypothetical protein
MLVVPSFNTDCSEHTDNEAVLRNARLLLDRRVRFDQCSMASERTYDGFAFGDGCRPDNEWYKFADPAQEIEAQEIELPWARRKPKHATEWKKNEAVDNGTDAGGAGLG